MNIERLASLTTTCGLTAFIALGSAQAQSYIHQPFADADGTAFTSAAPIPGITGYTGTAVTIKTSSALSYAGIVSSDNGYGPLNGRSYMNIDVSGTSPLAAYIAGGKVGGAGGGTLYISWMIKGASNGSANMLELYSGSNGNATLGTLFSGGGYRLVASGDGTGGDLSYQDSNITPSSAGVDFIVAKITFGPGNTDKVELFINQLAEGTPNVATGANRNVKFDQIAFGNFGGSEAIYDEVRVGATFADVAPASAEPAPNPPSALQATVNSFSEITLNWTDNSSNELHFTVERSPDGVNDWTPITTLNSESVSFQDVGLTAETAYYYRVNANNSGGNSAYSNTVTATTSALPAPVALDTIYLPFADEDGTNASLIAPVTGVLSFTEPGLVQTSSALSYPGVASSGNGFTTAAGRFYMTLDTTLPGLARYVSGGRIGGSGFGTLYVSWMARGINAQEANDVEFRTGSSNGNDVTVSVGTTFGNDFIRLITSSALNTGANNYVTSTVAPSPTTAFYVAKFTFGPGNTSTVDLYVNQTTEGTPNATNTGFLQFNTIAFAKFGGAAAPSIDEFRIGTSWTAVGGTASGTPLQTWFGSFSLPTDGTGTGAYTADPDNDGVSNLLEYAFDGNPTVSDGGNLPVIGKVNVSSSDYLSITFVRRTTPGSGITYTPQSSADLADWSGVPVQVGAAVDHGDGTETVVYRDNLPINGNAKRFLRVRVSAP